MVSIARTNSMICRSLVVLIIVTFTSGCTTMQPIRGTDGESLSNQISVGDTVEITRLDGEVVKFKVDDVLQSGVGGEGQFIAYKDIRQVRVARKGSATPALLIVGGIVAAILLVGLLEDNLSPGFPSP